METWLGILGVYFTAFAVSIIWGLVTDIQEGDKKRFAIRLAFTPVVASLSAWMLVLMISWLGI